MTSNYQFLSTDTETTELLETLRMAEENFTYKDYEGTLTKVRKVAENTARLIANKEGIRLSNRATFNDILSQLKRCVYNRDIIEALYEIKGIGNSSAHTLNAEDATHGNALWSLKQVHEVLKWVMVTYINPRIPVAAFRAFKEPENENSYDPFKRKFIYIQTVNNKNGQFKAYEGTQKIGEGSIKSGDLEADWSPNSEFLRAEAPKRISSYMTTSGLPYTLGWVELAFKKTTQQWFSDHDVHKVLKRSGIPQAEQLEGQEWFQTDLETAKAAIKAVKEGRDYLPSTKNAFSVEEPGITLRPEQEDAVTQTEKVFKKKDTMLWNAKMRFGKTLASLQLIKNMGFKKVLIMTHRPVVADSWFEDFNKMKMADAGYDFGSVDKGASLESLKKGEKSFIYFASIQLLRYNSGQTNLKEFAEVDWDFIIIDEAHEGTQTELSDLVLKELKKKNTKLLELSGTPFNLLDQFDEDQIYTWDYTMEQTAKLKWELERPNEPNPYESLPKVSMFTFEMKKKEKFSDESKSFNFREFFRVDEEGQFVYREDVRGFLNNITNPDSRTNYPFSTKEYREELRHTLWILPGVKEANALEDLLKSHPVFGFDYKIVNVVRGTSVDDGVTNEADIEKVRSAISKDPSQTKTITLTVRKLTTGVNIPEWTAVLFLSNTNSAMNYLQAAFRAQTPFSHEKLGMKKNCYVFDFAPDRALTVMAESAQINSGVGKKNTTEQKQAMARLLNFLPVLGQSSHGMKTFDVDRMLTQLKKVYAEKAVRSGFEDDSIYNDNLLTITADDVNMFNNLREIVGKTQRTKPAKITVAGNGLTNEEYEQAEKAQKKKPRERSEEELEAIQKQKEARKQRKALVSILRGVSIRIPMMIYGMTVDLSKDITIKEFINQVDEESWKEFMPKGFTKGMFREMSKYYDAEVFIEAGRIIRQRAKSYDELDYIERAEKIAELFGTFKNPDKETVLTPWRVVNLQLSKTIGGLNFYDDDFISLTSGASSNLHWVENEYTSKVYHPDTKILDINSKTGLYPLHAAVSLYYQRLFQNEDNYFNADAVYKEILANNIYAVAKTPMAKKITIRSLTGYKDYETNIVYIDGLINGIKEDINNVHSMLSEKLINMKFDVVIGNPPYQESATQKEMNLGQQQRVTNLFHLFQLFADKLNPEHSVLIYPGGRWMQQSGRGMKEFGLSLINSVKLSQLIYYPNANEIFGDVEISDGISIVHKNFNKNSLGFEYSFVENGISQTLHRCNPGTEIFVLDPLDESIAKKISRFVLKNHLRYLSESNTINQKLFQIESDFVEKNPEKVKLYIGQEFDSKKQIKLLTNDKSGKTGRATWYITNRENIKVRMDLVDKYKVIVSSANAGGQKRDNQLTILEPYTAFGRSRIALKAFDTLVEAENFYKYMCSNFIRFSLLLTDENLSSFAKFVPDILDYTNNQMFLDFSKDLDEQFFELLGLNAEEVNRVDNVNK